MKAGCKRIVINYLLRDWWDHDWNKIDNATPVSDTHNTGPASDAFKMADW